MMKALVFILIGLVAFTAKADRYQVDNDFYGSQGGEVEMRINNNNNSSDRFRGSTDSDGYTRLRDLNGNTVRGYIDNDGYGKLRDQNGEVYRLRP